MCASPPSQRGWLLEPPRGRSPRRHSSRRRYRRSGRARAVRLPCVRDVAVEEREDAEMARARDVRSSRSRSASCRPTTPSARAARARVTATARTDATGATTPRRAFRGDRRARLVERERKDRGLERLADSSPVRSGRATRARTRAAVGTRPSATYDEICPFSLDVRVAGALSSARDDEGRKAGATSGQRSDFIRAPRVSTGPRAVNGISRRFRGAAPGCRRARRPRDGSRRIASRGGAIAAGHGSRRGRHRSHHLGHAPGALHGTITSPSREARRPARRHPSPGESLRAFRRGRASSLARICAPGRRSRAGPWPRDAHGEAPSGPPGPSDGDASPPPSAPLRRARVPPSAGATSSLGWPSRLARPQERRGAQSEGMRAQRRGCLALSDLTHLGHGPPRHDGDERDQK